MTTFPVAGITTPSPIPLDSDIYAAEPLSSLPPRRERGGDHIRNQLPFAKCGCQTIAPGPPPECSAGPYDPVLVTRERTRFVIHSRPVRVRPGDESPSGPSLPIEPTRPTSPYHCFRPVVGPLVTSACRFNFASRRGFGRTLPSAHRSPCAMAAVLVAATMDLGPLPTCPSYLSRARECSSYGRLHALL